MACFALRQSLPGISGPLLIPRRSPPPPSMIPISTKTRHVKPLHLSSAATTVRSKISNNRAHECSCSANSTPAPLPGNSIFFVRDLFAFVGSIFRIIGAPLLRCTFILNSRIVLDYFPYPLFLATVYSFVGFLISVTYLARMTDIDHKSMYDLTDVSMAHSIGLVAELICLSTLSVTAALIVRGLEPLYHVVMYFAAGESLPFPVYLSLLPSIARYHVLCGDLDPSNLNMIGIAMGTIAGCAYAERNFFGEVNMRSKTGTKVTPQVYYAHLCMMSMYIITPVAIVFEGWRWSAAWKMAAPNVSMGLIFI